MSRRTQQRADSSESEDEPSQQSTRKNSQNDRLSGDIVDQLTNSCVYYLLVANQKGYPIKKTDILKHVFKDHPRAFPLIVSKATYNLKKIFGVDLVEVENKRGTYLLVNRLDFKVLESTRPAETQFWSDNEYMHHSLLIIVLTAIFMNGNVITGALLWQFLKKLGLDVESDVTHPIFGNVKKLISQEFVRKLYLEYKVIPGSEPPVSEFRLGQRALLETSKKEMLQLVCQRYEHMKPEHWASQFQDAEASDSSRS